MFPLAFRHVSWTLMNHRNRTFLLMWKVIPTTPTRVSRQLDSAKRHAMQPMLGLTSLTAYPAKRLSVYLCMCIYLVSVSLAIMYSEPLRHFSPISTQYYCSLFNRQKSSGASGAAPIIITAEQPLFFSFTDNGFQHGSRHLLRETARIWILGDTGDL